MPTQLREALSEAFGNNAVSGTFKEQITEDEFLSLALQENLWVNSGSGSSPIVRNRAILRTS